MVRPGLLIVLVLVTIFMDCIHGLTFTFTEEEVKLLQVKIQQSLKRQDLANSDDSSEEALNGSGQAPMDPKKIFAVLVAGSAGYDNYRHQADVCHAYQLLHGNGIPDENIVVMMFDDIAHNTENPTPGVIINRPNGTNVYEGVIKDYTGQDVNPDTFAKVLLGDESGLAGIGSGKVLKSGPDDHVFINFVDHGAPGLIAFPEKELLANDLEKILIQMHQKKKFGKLVFYLEACESGSMFDKLLPSHYNIFATTAANSDESSYACYYDSYRNTYLGDVYSVMWMENADQVDLQKETLQQQYLIVKNETNTSHVEEFGDHRLRRSPVADFLGHSSQRLSYVPVELDPVESWDVARIRLEKKISSISTTSITKKELEAKVNRLHKFRSLVREQFMDIVAEVTLNNSEEMNLIYRSRFPLTNYECYGSSIKYYSSNCLSIAKNSYVTRKLFVLVNLCERGWSTESIMEAMAHTCHRYGPVLNSASGIY